MFETPSLAEHDQVRDADDRRICGQTAVLRKLVEIGMKLAAVIERQADAALAEDAAPDEAPATLPPHIFLAYTKVARAVRMSLLLQERLTQRRQDARTFAVHDRRARVERIVERVALDNGESGPNAVLMAGEIGDRLETDDVYGDVMSRPVSDLIAEICRDLDLSPDWPKLAEEAWAREELDSGEVGWPLADVVATSPPGWFRELPASSRSSPDWSRSHTSLPRTGPSPSHPP